MIAAARRRSVPLIVATALFMQNLDANVLSTSLPEVAKEFAVSPIDLKLAVTSYLLALAIFIPASGWVADRYGARNVFRAAMLVFAAGSIGCALSQGLGSLVAARVLQGIGGAMMVPVGRLVILRTTEKHELVGAMAWLTVPALLAPVMGPPLGGFITTYFDWRWIFWINVPVAVLGVILATRFIPDIRDGNSQRFDAVGFLLIGPGLSMFLTGATVAGLGVLGPELIAALTIAGAVLLGLYVVHALREDAPIIDLRLLELPTFRASVLGGLLFRIGIGALPFLLPLLFQAGFGLTAFESGLLTFVTGIGAMAMKTLAHPILARFGFRNVLIFNTLIAAFFVAMPAVFTPSTPWLVVAAILLAGGFSRSLQFTAVNALAYADVKPDHLSRATSFTAVLQELSGAIGVSIAALGLELSQHISATQAIESAMFPPVFLAIALLSASSALIFVRLPMDAGTSLIAPETRKTEAAAPPPASFTG